MIKANPQQRPQQWHIRYQVDIKTPTEIVHEVFAFLKRLELEKNSTRMRFME